MNLFQKVVSVADDYFSQFGSADKDYFNQFKSAPNANAPPKKKKAGFEKVSSDVLSGIGAVPGALWDIGTSLPGQVIAGGKQLLTDPKRTGQNIIAGLGSGGAGLLNAPANVRDYLVDAEILPEKYPNLRLPENILPKDYDYRRGAGLNEMQKGDELSYGLSQLAPTAFTGGVPSALALHAIGQKENPVTAALLPGAAKKAVKIVGKTAETIVSPKKAIGFKEAEIIRQNSAKDSKVIADKIAKEDLGNFQKTGSQMYTSLIEDTKAKGISKAQIKKQLAPDFFKETTRKEKAAVRRAFETQSIDDIHAAYKDLGKYISKQSKKQLLKPERAALEQAKSIRKNMDGALKDAFSKAGGDEFAGRFDKANQYWRENVVPNEGNVLLNKYRAGLLTAEDFIKKASKNETFRAQLAKKYPELMEYADALGEADKKLLKAKPTTQSAQQLQKDVKRNELITQTPKKIANTATKLTGLKGFLEIMGL